ncbi:MAG: glycosyl transferase, partial [Clostridiales bacterium]|nr:glycosyl transferase [Candidatus Blautia equi]
QSVNEAVMIRRIDQQLRVNKLMVDVMHEAKFPNRKIRRYMMSYLDIITIVSSIMLVRSGTEENLQKRAELMQYIKDTDKGIYKALRYGLLGLLSNIPGKFGRKLFSGMYVVAQKIYGFN